MGDLATQCPGGGVATSAVSFAEENKGTEADAGAIPTRPIAKQVRAKTEAIPPCRYKDLCMIKPAF